MTMLNLVMPMADRGRPFADAGSATPLPLVPVYGQPLAKAVVDNLRPTRPHRFIFIIAQKDVDAFGLDQHLRAWCPGCVIVPVKDVTQGGATVPLAWEYIDNDDPLMLASCGQWLDVDIDQYLACMDQRSADGVIMTMRADGPQRWWCRVDMDGWLMKVAEEQEAGCEAAAGVCGYRRGRDFVAAAKVECDAARAYNLLIARGQKIARFHAGREREGVYPLASPADAEAFNKLADRLVTRLMRMSKMEGRLATLNRLATAVGQSRGTYVTFHERPLSASQIGTLPDPMHQTTSAGIVLQGPLRPEDDFTRNTVRLYRRHFPHAAVVVSTWDTEDPAALAQLRDAGATVLTNPVPENPTPTNINCQIVSTFAGVEWCRRQGLAYVLKTRTDQRLYAPNVLDYLRSLLETFPVAPGFRQNARIVGVSVDTFKFRYYGLGDHLHFGTTADMHTLWSVEQDQRPFAHTKCQSWHDASMRNVAETYLTTEFLKQVGRPLLWTLQDSLAAFGDHFCIVDRDDLDLFWPKYEAHKEHRMLAYDAVRNTQELTFRDWLLLCRRQIDTAKIPETGLHVPYGGHMY